MFNKNILLLLLFVFSLNFTNFQAYSTPQTCSTHGFSGLCKTISRVPSRLLQNPRFKQLALHRESNSSISVKTQQTESTYVFQHQMDGDWDSVTGHIGFYHNFPELGESFVSILGVNTTPDGNGKYTTVNWDRKTFWFDVGDGIPMHLAAEYFTETNDPEDDSLSIQVYVAYNLLYRQYGKDYSQTELNAEWIDFEFYTDSDNNLLDYSIILLNENDEEIDVRQFEPGDQVQSFTAVFDLDDPDTIWLTTMEEDFRTIQSEPIFMYENLSPNVDFPNETTKDLINFPKVDLQLTLLGINEQDDADFRFQFSTTKDLGLKWDGSVSSSVIDWVLHWFE